jgi:hypothetical protein
LAVFVFAVVWTVRYTATLPKQAKLRHSPISRADYRPARIAGLLGIASGTYGVLQYGSQSVAVFVWGALVIALLGVFFIGLPGLAAVKGAAHRPALTRLGFAALGLWQGFLTVTVPLILVFYGSWPNALLVTVTVVLGFGLSLVLYDGVKQNETVSYRVRMLTTRGEMLSDIENIDFSAQKMFLEVYPNPASDKVQVTMTPTQTSGQAYLEVYGTDGRLVHRVELLPGSVKEQIDLASANVDSGSYTVHLVSDGEILDVRSLHVMR